MKTVLRCVPGMVSECYSRSVGPGKGKISATSNNAVEPDSETDRLGNECNAQSWIAHDLRRSKTQDRNSVLILVSELDSNLVISETKLLRDLPKDQVLTAK